MKNGKFNTKKNYSSEEKYRYHNSRYFGCGEYGLKFGGTKHCYSTGFRDAFKRDSGVDGIRREFGQKSATAYSLGYKRGKKAAREYFQRTGKQPFSID